MARKLGTRTENRQFTSPLGIVCDHNFFVCCSMLTYIQERFFLHPSPPPSLIFPLPFSTWRVMRFPLLGRRRCSVPLPRFFSFFRTLSIRTSDGQCGPNSDCAASNSVYVVCLLVDLDRKLHGMGGTIIWSNQPSCVIF